MAAMLSDTKQLNGAWIEASNGDPVLRFPVRMLHLVMSEVLNQMEEKPLSSVELGYVDKVVMDLQGVVAAKVLDHGRSNDRSPQPFGPSFLREKTAASNDTSVLAHANPDEQCPSEDSQIDIMLDSDDLPEASVPIESLKTVEGRRRLLDMFMKLDKDGSGTISADELRECLINVGVPSARIQLLIRNADRDGSGEIDFEEWERAITEAKRNEGSFLHREWVSVTTKLETMENDSLKQKTMCTRFMMKPDSRLRFTLDICLCLACLYVATLLPFTIAYEPYIGEETIRICSSTEIVIDLLFILDVFMNFRTGYIDSVTGAEIMDWRRVRQKYLSSYFFVDVVSSLPFGVIIGGNMEWNRTLKLFKLSKMLKTIKLVGSIFGRSTSGNTFDMITSSPLVRHFVRRSSLLVTTIIICHWCACLMAFVSLHWLIEYDDVSSSLSSLYLAAVYYSLTTMTTVGYGDISATTDSERVFACFAMVMGANFYGYTVGTIASIVSSREHHVEAYHERMDWVFSWLKYHQAKLPKELRIRLVRYYKKVLSQKAAIEESDLMNGLSPALEKEVGEHLIPQEIRMNPIFDGLPFNATIRLLKISGRIHAEPYNNVVEPGEAGTAMFIVHKGSLILDPQVKAVLKKLATGLEQHTYEHDSEGARRSGAVHGRWDVTPGRKRIGLDMGDSFGEEILLGLEEVYKYKVTALEHCELHAIDEGAFQNSFQHMPQMLELIRANTEAVMRLKDYLEVNEKLDDMGSVGRGSFDRGSLDRGSIDRGSLGRTSRDSGWGSPSQGIYTMTLTATDARDTGILSNPLGSAASATSAPRGGSSGKHASSLSTFGKHGSLSAFGKHSSLSTFGKHTSYRTGIAPTFSATRSNGVSSLRIES